LASGTLEEVHDVEFDETKGSQDEDENLEDVRRTQLSDAMRKMDIGDIRPREVREVEDNKDQVISSPNIQASGSHSHDQTSSSSQMQDQQQMASTPSQPSANNQVQILQPTNIAKDHPLDSIIDDIQRGVQIRSRLISFCEYFSFVSFEEPKKIEDALKDPNWVNVMHDELNNFKINQVWELVERPKDHNVIGTKLVFKNKQEQDGIFVRNKTS
jgi:hypothetical protein